MFSFNNTIISPPVANYTYLSISVCLHFRHATQDIVKNIKMSVDQLRLHLQAVQGVVVAVLHVSNLTLLLQQTVKILPY